ncbi:MAG TPA: antitoxin of toxin-antitoxin stability system [Pararhizobium sp.]|nr:antitoxin of toxin-antitoxin stability system [Pararhizobium sp.]
MEQGLMSKEAVFTMKLEPELRKAFMAEASAAHRPASQIVRDLMRDFVERQREEREYDAFLHRKVDAARASMRDDFGRPNEEVEADFTTRRAALALSDDKSRA